MDKAIIVQNNTQVLTAPETYSYKIETTVTYKGELPQTQIFVYTINDDADPGADVFARVATVGDLDGTVELKTSRDDAVAAGDSEFLSSYFSIQYPDLTVAAQAKSAISTRINELINNWLIYRDQFMKNDGVNQFFPSSDPAFEQTLIDNYASAKEARIAAEAEVVTATAELALAEKDVTNAKAVYDIYKLEVDFCQKSYVVDWNALNLALTNLLGAETNFVSSSKTSYCGLATLALGVPVTWPPTDAQRIALAAISGAYTTWYSAITTFESMQNSYNTTGAPARSAINTEFGTYSTTAASKLAWAYNNVTYMESAASDAVTTKKEAEAALAAAQKAEDAALAAVMEVCPTFDPASV
jgi:hypothetical protein